MFSGDRDTAPTAPHSAVVTSHVTSYPVAFLVYMASSPYRLCYPTMLQLDSLGRPRFAGRRHAPHTRTDLQLIARSTSLTTRSFVPSSPSAEGRRARRSAFADDDLVILSRLTEGQ